MKKQFKELASLGSIYAINNILQKTLSFLLLPLITYYLTPKDYGIFGLLMLTVNLIIPFFLSPVNSGVYRFYYFPDYQSKLKEIIFTGLLFILIQGVIVGFIFYVFSPTISQLLFKDKIHSGIVKIGAIFFIIIPLSQYFLTLIQVQKRVFLVMLFSVIKLLGYVGVLLLLLVFFSISIKYMALAWAQLISVSIICVLSFCVMIKWMKLSINFKVLKPILAYGYPLIPTSIAYFVMSSSDVYILRIFASIDTVGLYLFASKFGGVINVFLGGFTKKALWPIIAPLETRPEELRLFLLKCTNYFAIAAFTIWFLLSLFSRDIIVLIAKNKAYLDAWTIIPFVSLIPIVSALSNYFNKGTAFSNRTGLISLSYIFSALLNIGFNFILVPSFGAIGAAIATVLAFSCFAAINAFFSYKTYNLKFEYFKIFKIFILALISLSLGIFCSYNLSFYLAFLTKILVIIFYFAMLFVFKIMKIREFLTLKNFVFGFIKGKLQKVGRS